MHICYVFLYIRAPVDSSGFLSLIGLLCLNKGVYLSDWVLTFDHAGEHLCNGITFMAGFKRSDGESLLNLEEAVVAYYRLNTVSQPSSAPMQIGGIHLQSKYHNQCKICIFE